MSRTAQQVLVLVVGLVAMFGFLALIQIYGFSIQVMAVAFVVLALAAIVAVIVSKKKK